MTARRMTPADYLEPGVIINPPVNQEFLDYMARSMAGAVMEHRLQREAPFPVRPERCETCGDEEGACACDAA